MGNWRRGCVKRVMSPSSDFRRSRRRDLPNGQQPAARPDAPQTARTGNRPACLALAAALVLSSACEVTVKDDEAKQRENAAGPALAGAGEQVPRAQPSEQQVREQARLQMQDLRFVVDKSERELRILQGGKLIRAEPVAVGKPEIPTPRGSWTIHRVDINPEWIPTNEPWAKGRTRKAPGDPENPMGRARLVYRMPNTIHGTDDTASLGKAASHGSIRVSNAAVLQLAEMVLRAGGVWQGPEWFRQMTEDRTREYQVKLESPVPVQVQE